jgi:hypothetical protein
MASSPPLSSSSSSTTTTATGGTSKKWEFEPPVTLGGFFGKDSDASDDDNDNNDNKGSSATNSSNSGNGSSNGESIMCRQQYVTRSHPFPFDNDLTIREISFHYLNANFVWPGARHLAAWISGELPTLDILTTRQGAATATPATTTTTAPTVVTGVAMTPTTAPRLNALRGKRVLELGAATGCLAIWLAKQGNSIIVHWLSFIIIALICVSF